MSTPSPAGWRRLCSSAGRHRRHEPSPLPRSNGDRIEQDGEVVIELTTVIGSKALGYVSKKFADPGTVIDDVTVI